MSFVKNKVEATWLNELDIWLVEIEVPIDKLVIDKINKINIQLHTLAPLYLANERLQHPFHHFLE